MSSLRVDLVYPDPPLNSIRTHEAPTGPMAAGTALKDACTLGDVDVHEHGEFADHNPAAYAVIEAARQTHGKAIQSYLNIVAVRLLEMRRVLGPDGSIYLHCDDVAGHWFRALMDALFGVAAFGVMDVGHMLPVARGKTNHPSNLQLLCSACNRRKGSKTMAEWRATQ